MLQANFPNVGDLLPDLPIQTTLGEARLTYYLGHQLVLYFYPKDDTPGCTVEGNDFSRLHGSFRILFYTLILNQLHDYPELGLLPIDLCIQRQKRRIKLN